MIETIYIINPADEKSIFTLEFYSSSEDYIESLYSVLQYNREETAIKLFTSLLVNLGKREAIINGEAKAPANKRNLIINPVKKQLAFVESPNVRDIAWMSLDQFLKISIWDYPLIISGIDY